MCEDIFTPLATNLYYKHVITCIFVLFQATPKILKGYRREKTYIEIPVRRNDQNTKPTIIQEIPKEKESVKPEISITTQTYKGNIGVSKQQLYETGEGTQSSPASLRTKNGKIHKRNDGNSSDGNFKPI